MKMPYKLSLILWCIASITYSQVGMITNSPNKDAVLDLNKSDGSNDKGLLLPRVALTTTNSPSPLTAHVKGIKVYNTATTSLTATSTNPVVPGVYYNDGTKWILENTEDTFWSIIGNSGTVTSTNKIGTLNSYPLITRTNNVEATRITTSNNYLIGTNTVLTGGSTALMAVKTAAAGAMQLRDGTQTANDVLTSDANGLATWQEFVPDVLYPNFVPAGGGVTYNTYTYAFHYTGCSLSLPPGKWLCSMELIAKKADGTYSDANTGATIFLQFSENQGDNKFLSTNTMVQEIGGFFPPNSLYGLVQGNIILENNTTVNKTIYLNIRAGLDSQGSMSVKFPVTASENKIILQRMTY